MSARFDPPSHTSTVDESADKSPIGLPRLVIGATGAIVANIVAAHSIGGLTRALGEANAPLAASALTFAAIGVALIGALAWRTRAATLVSFGAALGAVGLIELTHPGAWAGALALAITTPVVTAVAGTLTRRLPARIDDLADATRERRRRRWLAAAWIVVALASIVQVGRLATYMTDHESDWFLTTRHPFYSKHSCMSAYVHGAELAQRGEPNVYDAAHYPGLTPDAEPETAISGMVVEDPYQYAPQFLLLPAIATSMTNDYSQIELLWFGINAFAFGAIVIGLAVWIGGRVGTRAAFLAPLALIAFPALHNLQYGQFHMIAIALAVLAFMAFEGRRNVIGGSLLAIATLSKLFPGIMLVVLAVQRRWRALGATLVAMIALTGATLAVLGPEPFEAFFAYQIPRLQNGDAFAFGVAWPELADLITAGNQGAAGVMAKLDMLGVVSADAVTFSWATRLWGLIVLGLTIAVARPLATASRASKAVVWLGILGMASLASGGAFADYVPATAVWLLTLLVPFCIGNRRLALALAPIALLQFFLIGTMPIGGWFEPRLFGIVSLVGAVSMMALFGGVVVAQLRARRQPISAPSATAELAISAG